MLSRIPWLGAANAIWSIETTRVHRAAGRHGGSEMALHVLAYNLTRVMNIMGIQPLVAAIRA